MDYVYRWSIIAQQLPGRTDSDVKNHWNTKLRKKLSETGIDPVTHKPLSQILVDYGNSGGLRKSDTRTSSLNKDLKDAIVLKSEPYPSPPQGFPNINIQVMPSTTSPQTAPTQDTFLNNNETNNITFPPPIFVEESLSSSSSSSPTCSTAAQENSTLDLIWHDFLLDDAFLPADPLEQEIMADHSSKLSASQKHDVIPQNETNKEAATQECLEAKAIDCAVLSDYFPPPSSSDIIFCRCHTRSRISNVVRLPKPFGGAILLLSSLQVDGIETIALEI